jgi:hypothetical protein
MNKFADHGSKNIKKAMLIEEDNIVANIPDNIFGGLTISNTANIVIQPRAKIRVVQLCVRYRPSVITISIIPLLSRLVGVLMIFRITSQPRGRKTNARYSGIAKLV